VRSTVLGGTGAWQVEHPNVCCGPWWQLWHSSRVIVLVASRVSGA
jgi:hypothetical protein